jgi:hypothetical protein
MTANQERGEFALELDGASFTLRPSYEAILAFEADTGKGLMDLTRAALGGVMSLTELAIVATQCIRAWGKEHNDTGASGVNAVRIGGLIMESNGGISHAMTVIGSMLALATTGGINAKGEVKAAAETTSQTTGSRSDAA